MPTFDAGNKRAALTAFAFLFALAAMLFFSWPALTGPFLFDDFPNLEQLATLDGHTDWTSLANFAAQYRSQPGRPLAMLSFVLNDYDWPSTPWSFKYTNLMLHALIGVLIFGFSRSLARMRLENADRGDFVALLAAAAWLLHPMQLSTSMLVVQRMTQLSALFAIAALWSYVALTANSRRPGSAVGAIAALGVGTVLSTLCKETGALTPLLALVLNQTLLRQQLAGLPRPSRLILQLGTLLPVVALALEIAFRWNDVTGYGSRTFTMGERLLTESRVLCEYLFKIVVPSLRGGGIYHDDFVVSHNLFTPWTTILSVAVLAGAIGAAILRRRTWPVFSFAVLWFLADHLLESTVFPLELYFEHRNYLPMVGILFALAYWVANSAARFRKAVIGLSIAWIGFAAWLTSIQAPIWGNQDALVAVWAIEHPRSPRAIQQKAAYEYRRGDNAAAAHTLMGAYARGVRGSDFPLQVLLLGCSTHDLAMAREARAQLYESLARSEYNRATLVTARKLRTAVQDNICPGIVGERDWLAFTDTLLKNPSFASGDSGAYLHVERAYLYTHKRDLGKTMLEFEQAWAMNPTPELGQLMAATLASAGLYDLAEEWAERALDQRTKGLRGWFSSDEVTTERLLKAIRAVRQRQAHRTKIAAESNRDGE